MDQFILRLYIIKCHHHVILFFFFENWRHYVIFVTFSYGMIVLLGECYDVESISQSSIKRGMHRVLNDSYA